MEIQIPHPTSITKQSTFKATADKKEKRILHSSLISIVKQQLHVIVNINRKKCTVI
jgi:hypothetical protein